MRIIRESEIADRVEYHLRFWRTTEGPRRGVQYDFPCDASGALLRPLNPDAEENYVRAIADPDLSRSVERDEWTYRVPAVGACEVCGRPVELSGFTCTCECGTDYNASGQRLAPREQWGEETGETLADIIGPNYDPEEIGC